MANCKLCNQVCKGLCLKLSWESGTCLAVPGGSLLSLGPRGHGQGWTPVNPGCSSHRDPSGSPSGWAQVCLLPAFGECLSNLITWFFTLFL